MFHQLVQSSRNYVPIEKHEHSFFFLESEKKTQFKFEDLVFVLNYISFLSL